MKRSKNNDRVIGDWYEDSGMLFRFSNNEFYWYKDFTDLENNYYKGNLEIINLCDLDLTDKQIKEEYGDIHCKDYYEIKLYPKELISDKKNEKYRNNYFLKFALYFAEKNEIYLYDFRQEKFYSISKINNF